MLEHWGSGALGYWSTGILVHWDSGAHCHCNHKFGCGNLVEFDLSADCVHECNCTRSPIFLSLKIHLSPARYVVVCIYAVFTSRFQLMVRRA